MDNEQKVGDESPNRLEGGFPRALPAPAQRALESAGYTRLDQLAGVPEREIAKLHGMGPKALARLREALAAAGLSFGE